MIDKVDYWFQDPEQRQHLLKQEKKQLVA